MIKKLNNKIILTIIKKYAKNIKNLTTNIQHLKILFKKHKKLGKITIIEIIKTLGK